MRTLDPAVSVGAAIALVAGVASAELGLMPIRHTSAAVAPSTGTTDANGAPAPLQAELTSEAQSSPPAVVVPVRTAPRRSGHAGGETAAPPDSPVGANEETAPRGADEDERAGDDVDVPQIAAREPQPGSSAPTDASPEDPPPVSPG